MRDIALRTTLGFLACVPTSALGEEVSVNAEGDVQHRIAVTLSPLHLILPVVEVTAEYRMADRIGLAGIFGAGKVGTEQATPAGTVEHRFTAVEAGTQFRYYPIGNFVHGMQVGAELLYLYVGRGDSGTSSAFGEGLAVGPFAGYKIATNVGFTFDAQLGFEYVAAHAEASTPGGSTSAKAKTIIPLVNLNVGWSF